MCIFANRAPFVFSRTQRIAFRFRCCCHGLSGVVRGITDPEWKQACHWRAEEVHHGRDTPSLVCHVQDTDDIVYARDTFFNTALASKDSLYFSNNCSSKITTSGPSADTHGLLGYEPNQTNNQNAVSWTEDQNLKGVKLVHGPTQVQTRVTTLLCMSCALQRGQRLTVPPDRFPVATHGTDMRPPRIYSGSTLSHVSHVHRCGIAWSDEVCSLLDYVDHGGLRVTVAAEASVRAPRLNA